MENSCSALRIIIRTELKELLKGLKAQTRIITQVRHFVSNRIVVIFRVLVVYNYITRDVSKRPSNCRSLKEFTVLPSTNRSSE